VSHSAAVGRANVRVLLLVFFGAMGGVIGVAIFSAHRAEVRRLEAELKREKELRVLYEGYLTNVLGERKAAEVVVLEQAQRPEGPWTKLRFLEYAADEKPLTPKTFEVVGNEIYFDALVLQFQPEAVEKGEAKSLLVFRRLFSDRMKPEEGLSLCLFDGPPPDILSRPEVPVKVQSAVWDEFRRCAYDKPYAEKRKVRALYGQAVYKPLRKGILYTLRIQNNGGLLIEESPVPAILRETP